MDFTAPQQIVETAARTEWSTHNPTPWDDASAQDKAAYLERANTILAAALPALGKIVSGRILNECRNPTSALEEARNDGLVFASWLVEDSLGSETLD